MRFKKKIYALKSCVNESHKWPDGFPHKRPVMQNTDVFFVFKMLNRKASTWKTKHALTGPGQLWCGAFDAFFVLILNRLLNKQSSGITRTSWKCISKCLLQKDAESILQLQILVNIRITGQNCCINGHLCEGATPVSCEFCAQMTIATQIWS